MANVMVELYGIHCVVTHQGLKYFLQGKTIQSRHVHYLLNSENYISNQLMMKGVGRNYTRTQTAFFNITPLVVTVLNEKINQTVDSVSNIYSKQPKLVCFKNTLKEIKLGTCLLSSHVKLGQVWLINGQCCHYCLSQIGLECC